MYLKLDPDDVKIEPNDILNYFERTYGLSGCYRWYEKEDGQIYQEVYGRYEERVELTEVRRKAYDIYRQIQDLYRLQSKK